MRNRCNIQCFHQQFEIFDFGIVLVARGRFNVISEIRQGNILKGTSIVETVVIQKGDISFLMDLSQYFNIT